MGDLKVWHQDDEFGDPRIRIETPQEGLRVEDAYQLIRAISVCLNVIDQRQRAVINARGGWSE